MSIPENMRTTISQRVVLERFGGSKSKFFDVYPKCNLLLSNGETLSKEKYDQMKAAQHLRNHEDPVRVQKRMEKAIIGAVLKMYSAVDHK